MQLITDEEADQPPTDEAPRDRRDVVVRFPGTPPESDRLVIAYVEPAEQQQIVPIVVADRTTIDVDTPPAYRILYEPPIGSVRYRVLWGGRGAGRSWQIARRLLVAGRERQHRILCTREWQNSIKDSVQRVLRDQIRYLGLGGFYKVTESSIVGENGTEFLFKGLRRDINAIKSMEGITICWVEEGQAVSDESWRELTPTIRFDNSEIWVSFNTGEEEDATFLRFVAPTIPEHPRYDAAFNGIVRKTSYRDNPWLPKVLKDEEQASRRTDPEEHAHVWDGEFWKRSRSQVLHGKWRVAEFTPTTEWGEPYYGVDFGFANDPLVIGRFWEYDSRLWVEYTEGGLGYDEHDDIAELFDSVPGSRTHRLWADGSRPETISALHRRGFDIMGAPKWEGSVKDGIAHLRHYEEIIIHPRAERAKREAMLWRYKTRPGPTGDPNGADAEVLPALVDGNEHTWDACRYAINTRIRHRPRKGAPRPSVSQEV
jgi:phage terminase large subunit